jgi:hypothetical protein
MTGEKVRPRVRRKRRPDPAADDTREMSADEIAAAMAEAAEYFARALPTAAEVAERFAAAGVAEPFQ